MNAFSSYHPAVLMLYFLAVLLLTMFTPNPMFLSLALLGAACFCTVLERPRDFWRNLAFYIPLFLLIAVTNPLFSHNGVTPLFFLNGNPVTLEAILYGLDIAAMLVAVIYWFQCYNHIMTSEKILFLFGKAAPKLSLLLSSALRFVPLFQKQIQKVRQAQKAMGLYASPSYWDKLKGAARVFSAMLTWSLENAVDTGASMKARGYGLKGRSHFALFRFTLRDGVLLGLIVLLLLCILPAMLMRQTAFSFYPRVSAFPLTPATMLSYAAFAVLSFLPFILEMEENLKWKYYRSKI